MMRAWPEVNVFENQTLDSDYEVEILFKHFRSVCPVTHKPDVGTLRVAYKPGHLCLEGFSLSELVRSMALEEVYHEELVNILFRQVSKKLNPKYLLIEVTFPLYSRLEGSPMSLTVRRCSS